MQKQIKAHIKNTISALLEQEDTDGDKKITKEDQGPKSFTVTLDNGGDYTIEGTYFLSNFLQELALAQKAGQEKALIALDQIEEPPSGRISRMIRSYFWDDLTRTMDKEGLMAILNDDKTTTSTQRIYVPATDAVGQAYYNALQQQMPTIEVIVLPYRITPAYVKSINDKPGILALALENNKGVPFVVPGGRFNEMYGWDSYFEGVGLLLDGKHHLAKAMVDNFCYQIEHYGKILNANRSYYLTRTQPPFLTSFIREVYEADTSLGLAWLKKSLTAAIKEYTTVWMEQGQRLTTTGLNRYFAQGIGIPPETEPGHFDEVLSAFAKAQDCSLEALVTQYQSGALTLPELDAYFTHDRSLRESGHDTSWRLDNCCAHLNTVDLNSLLYKYERDIAHLIVTYFEDSFDNATSATWLERAALRKERMNTLLWDDNHGQFFDYDFVHQRPKRFEAASNFFPLWAGLCSKEQAQRMVNSLMTTLKEKGGIAGTSKAMDDQLTSNALQRQWDYPNGWAPHQMMLWKGLYQYGYQTQMQELIYRWLWMITQNAVDYNGTIPEKYDVVHCTHKVYAEYGNVGTNFDYITTSGFGWMNASYQYGLSLLNPELRKALDALTDPELLF